MLSPDPSDPLFWIDRIIDSIFILDLLLSFFRPYVNSTGETVVYIPAIGYQYCSFWFWPDLIASVPYDLVDVFLAPTER